jgi:hypothetical protein
LNLNVTRSFTAANPATTGGMPSTLGTLTGVAVTQNVFLLEV